MKRLVLLAVATMLVAASPAAAHGRDPLRKIDHFVVVYQENHSFDNLYGGWEKVDGLRDADAAHTRQVDQSGAPYACLLQVDVNLAPLGCSAFPNAPFRIEDYIAPDDTTCPKPGMSAPDGVLKGSGLPGGCTRDLVHRFYQEQYQLNGGRQNRYVTGSDAVGLTMGHYDTRKLPVYKYLHRKRAPSYVISDRFFQAAFGGSFLNHQWLVAAATPVFTDALNDGSADDLHSQVDGNGMPTSYPLYTATGAVKDQALTVKCSSAHPAGLACGDYAVNTDPAALPAVRARHRRGPAAAAADGADDRQPAERQGRRLGVVQRRLVERERRRRRPGLDERHGRHLRRPRDREWRGLPELPERAVPVPPPAAQLLRRVRAGHGGPPRAPARRGRVPGAGRRLAGGTAG